MNLKQNETLTSVFFFLTLCRISWFCDDLQDNKNLLNGYQYTSEMCTLDSNFSTGNTLTNVCSTHAAWHSASFVSAHTIFMVSFILFIRTLKQYQNVLNFTCKANPGHSLAIYNSGTRMYKTRYQSQ